LSATHVDATYGEAQPAVSVGAIKLADFYARVMLNSEKRLNLSDIMRSSRSTPTSLTRETSGTAVEPPLVPAPPTSTSNARSSTSVDIAIGGITAQNGHVNWTDDFIQPHYTADLTDIRGNVGAFGTRSTAPSDVSLTAKINRTSPVEISGRMNPLTTNPYVNIDAKAQGVELSEFTPYSTKYTGYPITKGTLSVNVHYLLDHKDLRAHNQIFLAQLTFGKKVESPSAINLPIRLVVALLADSQGRINVDVPVSGSLSDPHFTISGAFLSALKNIATKTVSSPFKVLASVAGAREQLDHIDFRPGLAELTPESQSKLDKLAAALKQKPALQLSISARIDPKNDRRGLREAKLIEMVKQQKVKTLANADENVDLTKITVSSDEYNKYLKRAYKAAAFEKPRNFLGLVKSLPPDEMKRSMLDHITVTDEQLRKLADARAQATRNWLAKQIDPSRLLVVAPKLDGKGIVGNETARVDLSLE
jgi:hypothetical protein